MAWTFQAPVCDGNLAIGHLYVTPNFHAAAAANICLQGEVPVNTDALKCSPIFEIRETQAQGHDSRGIHPIWQQDTNPNTSTTSSAYPSLYASEGTSINGQMGQGPTASSSDGFDNGYGFPIQSVGTETSPENSNNDGSNSRPQSNHPTPSTLSNQNSSHTSYTSPHTQSTGSSSNNANSAQAQQSPGLVFSGHHSWNMSAQIQLGHEASPSAQPVNFGSTGMTPGATGMTPMPDSMWPADGLPDGNEWMFAWPGSTPQPQ